MAIGDKIDWRAGTIDPTTLQLIASAGAAQGAMYQSLGESVSKAFEKDSEDYIVDAGKAFDKADKLLEREDDEDFNEEKYEDNKKIAVEQANIDVKNATLENEFLLGSNISLASRSGIHAYSSGSFLANRAYNTRVLNDTLYQIDLNKNAKITQANIGISQAGLSARYAVWGAAGNVAGTLANTSYKLHQLDTSGKATVKDS